MSIRRFSTKLSTTRSIAIELSPMPTCMRPIRFIATFLLCVIALCAQAASLWMANDVEVRRIDLTGETADQRIPLANVIRLAAARNGGAFALTKHGVTRIAADGRIGPSLDVQAIGYGPPSSFATDAQDDTVWVLTHGNLLIHVGADGTVEAG